MLRHYVMLASAIVLVAIASFYPFAPSWMVVAQEPDQTRELMHLAEGDVPITLNFQRRGFREIIEALSKSVRFEVEYEGELPQPTRIVSIEMKDVTAVDVLERIAVLTGVSYRVPNPYTLVVEAPRLAGVDGVTNPRRIPESRIVPSYPPEARAQGIGGKVFLEALLDREGTVDRVKVLRGIPDHPEFEQAAVAAIMEWRYEPATKDGKPVAVWFTVIMDFTLGDDEEPERPVGI